MKLYYSPGACSLAAHILMHEAGLKFDIERVNTKEKRTETGANYLEVTPKGYVPALRLDDEDVLTENVVIHGYIADLKPGTLAPKPGTSERRKLDELAVYITTEIHKGYSPLFNPAYPDDVKAAMRDRLALRYELIENLLADGRPYLTGEAFQTVDAYLFTLTNWARATKVDLTRFPAVLAFHKRVAGRPAVKAAMEAEGLLKAA